MIINLAQSREQYFEEPTVAEILRQYVKDGGPITINDLKELDDKKYVIGTKEGSLEQLLQHQSTVDSLLLANKIKQLQPDQLLVLPPHYRINASESRNAIAYSLDTLVKLDASEVKRKLLGTVPNDKPLSARRKQQEQWHPEKVISTAFNLLQEHKEQYAEKTLSCYSWWGKDNHRRIISLYRSIQGAELRAFQDYVAFKLLIPTFKKELRTHKNTQTKKTLTLEEEIDRRTKVLRYEKYVHTRNIEPFLKEMNVAFTDLIEPLGGFSFHTGQMMRVPSRSQKDYKYYTVKITDLPLLEHGNPAHYSLAWELAGNCICPDKIYRSDRRKQAPDKGNREDFFCPHEIAATLTLRKKYETGHKQTINYLPFVLPTKEMMNYVEKLRHQTIMLAYNQQTERWSKRSLNHTEIENILWKKIIIDGYDKCFTTNINTFKECHYDPHLDLIQFRR
ncbi:hypothetical protein HYX11_02985 [Candidatus Woesearchaeota archaeon]|nr:hypothetical protein [Candidatus Woesearchaeota archaeon]